MQTNLMRGEYDSFDDAAKALPEWLGTDCVESEPRFIHDAAQIGMMIRSRREKAGMSLRAMAKWMSISPTYLSDMERGRRPWPAERIHHATDVLAMAERNNNEN